MRKIIAMVLAVSMIFALCACGNEQGQNNTQQDKQNQAEVTTEPSYVYAANISSVLQGTKYSFTPVQYTDTGVFCQTYEKVGEREPREGEVIEYEGQLDVFEQCLYFISYEGNVTKLDSYKAVEVDSVIPEEYRNAEEKPQGYSVATVGTPNGKLISITEVYESWNTAPANVTEYTDEWFTYSQYISTYYIRVLNQDGAEESMAKIVMPEDQTFYFYGAAAIDDEHVIVGTDSSLMKIASDGTYEMIDIGNVGYVEGCADLADGKLGVTIYDDGYKLMVVDKQTLKAENTYDLPVNAYDIHPGKGEDSILYVNGISVYSYNYKTKESEKLFNWLSLDIDPDEVYNYNVMPDGTIVSVTNNWDKNYTSNNVNILKVSLVPQTEVPEKTVLVMATQYLDYEIRRLIIDFNRKHKDVRIEVITYSDYNTDQDWSAGRTKLITEIMAGQVPDLIDLSGMPKAQMASKGILEDLYPYIDNDSKLSREDFFANVLEAGSIDGKLYNTIPAFRIYSCAGAKNIVGDRIGWTYDEVFDALSNLPEGAEIFDVSTTQNEVLNMCLSMEMGNLVDWNKGTCRFDSKEFVDLLKFASMFKSEFDWENYEWTEDETLSSRIMSGKQMLMNAYLYDFSDMMYYGHYFGGEENVSFIGFPTSDGSNGSAFDFGGVEIAMSSKCADKNAAWEFLREMMTEEYQSEMSNGYPSNIKAFMSKLEEAKTPDYVLDSNGNRLLNANGEYVLRPKVTYGDESGEYSIYNMSEEMAETILELVNTTTKVVKNDESIMTIVTEQTAPFFACQKTAEEVAKFVQSKANIYINEQK